MKLVILAASASVALSACATITRGTNDVFMVNTVPSQAQVTTTNGFACVSPCALKMPRRSEFDVVITKAGYETAQAHVTNGVAGAGGAAMAGNVILGGIIGAGVDAGTGAMLDLKPNPLNVTLAPLGTQVAQAVPSSAIVATTVAPVAVPAVAAAPVTLAAPPATVAASPATPQPVAPVAAVAATAPAGALTLPPVPTQTTRLPGHRLAARGCPGFAPRVLYAASPDKLPTNCESVTPL